MFGLGFGELCVLLVVAMVVLGPKELPRYLRKAGQWAGRLRRLAIEMREKSGIDEILRTEGLDRDIAEIRRLARGEVMGIQSAMRALGQTVRVDGGPASAYAPPVPAMSAASGSRSEGLVVPRERELPPEGADSYGALPDTAVVYEGLLVASPLADDALYVHGLEAPPETAPQPPTQSPMTRPPPSASTPPA